jgi:hypothetical protein
LFSSIMVRNHPTGASSTFPTDTLMAGKVSTWTPRSGVWVQNLDMLLQKTDGKKLTIMWMAFLDMKQAWPSAVHCKELGEDEEVEAGTFSTV